MQLYNTSRKRKNFIETIQIMDNLRKIVGIDKMIRPSESVPK